MLIDAKYNCLSHAMCDNISTEAGMVDIIIGAQGVMQMKTLMSVLGGKQCEGRPRALPVNGDASSMAYMGMAALFLSAMAFVAVCGVADAAEPVQYWFCKCAKSEKVSEANFLMGADPSAAATVFVDGNILCAAAPAQTSSDVPAHVVKAVQDNGWGGTIKFDKPLSAYGVYTRYGSRTWDMYGGSPLTIGEGGWNGTSGWMCLHLVGDGGIVLKGTQTWNSPNEYDFSTPVSATSGTVWTLNGMSSVYRYLFFTKSNSLADVDVIVSGQFVIGLGESTGALRARSLTLSGPSAGFFLNSIVLSKDDASQATTIPYNKVVDARFSTNVILTADANLSKANFFDGAILDPAVRFTVTGSGASIGEQANYSIKDEGEFSIDVASGATLTMNSLPALGRLKITGTGRLVVCLPSDVTSEILSDKLDMADFTGVLELSCRWSTSSLDLASLADYKDCSEIVFADASVRVRDLAGFKGKITLRSDVGFYSQSYGQYKTSVALPPTSEWEPEMRVSVGTRSMLYLPDASDAGVASRVTGPYTVGCRGWTDEPAGTTTVGAGQVLHVIGDGFGANTEFHFKGGAVFFPVSVTCGSTIRRDTAQTESGIIGAGIRATATLMGKFGNGTHIGSLTFSNAVNVVDAGDSWFCEQGTLRFANPTGGVIQETINVFGGRVVFDGGGSWTFHWSNSPVLNIANCATSLVITNGTSLTFMEGYAANSSKGSRETGIQWSVNGRYQQGIHVYPNSTLTFGAYRNVQLGGSWWASACLLWARGGTVRILGPGGRFSLWGTSAKDLKNTTADRCGALILRATDGGVIENERVLISSPVSHADPSIEVDDYRNCGFTVRPGLHVELDNGTLRYGENFGRAKDVNEGLCRPFLFAQGVNLYQTTTDAAKSYTADYDHTAEVRFRIGPGGGTLDLSPVTAYATLSNTVQHALTPVAGSGNTTLTGKDFSNLGPRWIVDGPFIVKGNGEQTFVINDWDGDAAFTNVVADGVRVKVASDMAKTYHTIGFGAKPGSWTVERLDGSAPTAVSFAQAHVAESAIFDASAFNAAVTISKLDFDDDAVLEASSRSTDLPVIGTAALPSALKYWSELGRTEVGFTAGSVNGSPTWSAVAGSRRRNVIVRETGVYLFMCGTLLIVR